MKKLFSVIMCLFLALALVTGCQKDEVTDVMNEEIIVEEIEVIEPSPFYKNMQADDRAIAVMIDNDGDYKGPQAGLHKAFMIYEAYVEGGSTRMMALFKESFFSEEDMSLRIGPVRSSRHYFLDFAIENDAIYAHCGWSPKAMEEISSRGVNNLNGLYEAKTFYRYSGYNNSWHNLYTDYERMSSSADNHGYRRETEKTYNYYENFTLPSTGQEALKVSVPYLLSKIVYEYDEEMSAYKRFKQGSPHTMQTGEDLYATNIVILEMQNVDLNDGDGKGRQDLYNVGTGKGLYITGGKVNDITWSKADRSAPLELKLNGEDLVLNPGLTFVQIVPAALGVFIG